MSILALLVIVGLILVIVRVQVFLLKLLVGLVLIGMLASGAWSQTTQVRDSSGRLIQTQDRQGSLTTVRDQDGRTSETWDYQGNEKVVRDQYGRTIRMERER